MEKLQQLIIKSENLYRSDKTARIGTAEYKIESASNRALILLQNLWILWSARDL